MVDTNDLKKVVLVGNNRTCQQVAFVLGLDEYEIINELTMEGFRVFAGYQIYVCEKKKHSKSIVAHSLSSEKKIKYLDDICRWVDREYLRKRRLHKKALNKEWSGTSFLARCKLRCFYWLVKVYFRLTGFLSISRAKKGQYAKIKNLRALRCLKPSQLFLYVLNAPVNENVHCDMNESDIQVTRYGEVRGCCSTVIPFGHLLYDGELSEIYHSIYARIVKLSSLNGSYALCNLNGWCPYNGTEKTKLLAKSLMTKKKKAPRVITVAIDRTCNLCCKSCRNKRYVMDKARQLQTTICADKLKRSEYLDQAEQLVVAAQGEVFYSPYYRNLLDTELKRESICLLSNGLLFNEANWNWIKDKYKVIDACISVDAATADTYRKIRGADFNVLLKNLRMISDLRRQGKIRYFNLNFVVQRDNFREMPDFVRLAKSLGADHIEFQRMNNFGNLTKKEFLQKCLIINDEYLDRELWEVLQDPIFAEPIADLRILEQYIKASAMKYGQAVKDK